MSLRIATISVLALGLATARTQAERIQLTSGDHITAKVISQTPEHWVVEHPDLGTLTLPAAKVKAVLPDPPQGADANFKSDQSIHPSVEQRMGGPTPPPGAQPEDISQTIDRQSESNAILRMLEDWDSKVELGFNGSGSDSDSDTQNAFVRIATRNENERTRWLADASYFLGRSNGQTTRNQSDVKITHDWLFQDSPWFAFGRGEYKFDQFRAWKHRASAYGGMGYVFLDSQTWELTGRLGLGGTYEFGTIEEWTPEAFFGGSAAKWNLTRRQTLASELVYFPSLEALEEYRIQGKLWWQYKLDFLDGLSLKVGAEDEYDSDPDESDDRHDFKYYGALVFEF